LKHENRNSPAFGGQESDPPSADPNDQNKENEASRSAAGALTITAAPYFAIGKLEL